jgi:hypothetical protein
VYEINDVRQTEIPAAEPLVPEPSSFEVENSFEQLRRYVFPGIVSILAIFDY